jgi:serine/threonine-protein kinase
LLALNNELITPAALVAALREWGDDRSKSICEILAAAGHLDVPKRQQIELQCADHLRQYGGDPELGLATLSVSDNLRDGLLRLSNPELTLILTQTLATTGPVDLFATQIPTQISEVSVTAEADPSLTRLSNSALAGALTPSCAAESRLPARYRIVRLHARGGLGLVSLAEDGELQRHVALKEIQPRHADDVACRAAFLSEAEITARLEHPGVVPVYGLGRYSDGRPYYAMRFIRGLSLREAIVAHYAAAGNAAQDEAARELEFRGLIGRFIAVCNTLDYAHSRGVLHRDLKPANIMLGDYGETLVVDWGLAAVFAGENAPDVHQTQETGTDRTGADENTARPASRTGARSTGSAIGTPHYMSPEQAAGRIEELGPATDIYSLGTTLYELLTGSVPFEAATIEELLQHVSVGKLARPCSRRPSCPRALEAVCLKAMALRPEDRYASTRELARDLERWLADEPVAVCREHWSQRAARWMRRHRAATQAAAGALVTITAVALIAALVIYGARRREAAARVEATQRSQQAREVIDTLLTNVGEALENYPGMQQARRRLLQRAADDYSKLTGSGSPDPDLRAEAARAFSRLGDVRAMLNQFDEADQAYRSSESLWNGLRRDLPQRRIFHVEYANCVTRRAMALAAHGNPKDAEAAFQEAQSVLTPVASADPDDLDATDALGTVLVNLGRWQGDAGRQAEAEQTLTRAVSLFERIARNSRALPRYSFAWAAAMNALGRFFVARGHEQDAISLFRQAENVYRLLVAEHPDEAEYLSARASTRLHLAAALRDFGSPDAEATLYRESVVDYATLLAAVPDVPRYRENLSVTRTNLGQALHQIGQNHSACAELENSLSQLDELASEYPAVPGYLEGVATTRVTLASVLRELARFDEGLEAARRGVDDYQQLIQALPDVPRYRAALGVALSHRARIQIRNSALGEAEQDFQRAASELSQAIGAVPQDAHFRENLSAVWTHHAWLRRRRGDAAGCRDFQRQAIEVLERLTVDFPETARFCDSLAWQLATGPTHELIDIPHASSLALRATTLVPDNKFYWRTLGVVQYRIEDWAAARKSLRKADELRPAEGGITACVEALVEQHLGNHDAARSLLDEAHAWSDLNRPGDDELQRFREEATALLAGKVPVVE